MCCGREPHELKRLTGRQQRRQQQQQQQPRREQRKAKHSFIYIEVEQKHIHSLRIEQSMQRNLNNNTAAASATGDTYWCCCSFLFSV